MIKNVIYTKILYHRKQKVIMCSFGYDDDLIKIFKAKGAHYSKTYKSWYLPYSILNINWLKSQFKHLKFETSNVLKQSKKTSANYLDEKCRTAIADFEMKLKALNYSYNSIKSYKNLVTSFLKVVKTTSFTQNQFMAYLAKLKDANYTAASLRQITAAIKKFSILCRKTKLNDDFFKYPRKSKPLPKVISVEAIKKLIDQTTNLKHKTIIATLYATGMRRGELLRLKINDIDGKRNTILIKNGKGYKDRVIPLSKLLKKLLRQYFLQYRPKIYLFEGLEGQQYSGSSVNAILNQSAMKSRLNKKLSAHILRHSYATHLLENGTNLRYIQELLGHKSSRTTEIYTKVSNHSLQDIINPLDTLFEVNNKDLPF